jgi:hypothetical protein
MLKRKHHSPADPNVTAFRVVQAATENVVIPDRLVPVGEILASGVKPKKESSPITSEPQRKTE